MHVDHNMHVTGCNMHVACTLFRIRHIDVMHIAIVFPNHRIIYINTHNACITYCYPCTCTEVISNYYITWRAIIYRGIFRSRSTISARPKGGRIPRSRTAICDWLWEKGHIRA